MTFRVLVCGGRDYSDKKRVFKELDALADVHDDLVIIEGGARGADAFAKYWAIDHPPVVLIHVPADWKGHGQSAGMLRNIKMLALYKPDLVLAFPGGKGTAHMVRHARLNKIEVKIISTGEQ